MRSGFEFLRDFCETQSRFVLLGSANVQWAPAASC